MPAVDATRARRYDAEALVDVAVREFNARGYDATSIDDLARAAGLAKSSIYHHVASKEELLERALRRALDALFAMLSEPAVASGRAVDRLRAALRRSVEILGEHRAEVALLLRVRGNSATERWALERRRAFDEAAARLIAGAMRDGDLRADVDPKVAARLLLGAVNSLVDWYRPEGPLAPEAMGEELERVLLDGLAAGRAPDAGAPARR